MRSKVYLGGGRLPTCDCLLEQTDRALHADAIGDIKKAGAEGSAALLQAGVSCWRMLTGQMHAVIGVSSQSVDSHIKFRSKLGLPFSLLADEGGKVGPLLCCCSAKPPVRAL